MNRPEKWIDLQWESGIGGEFAAEVRIEVVNQKGVLATVAAAIAETDANIENVQTEDRDGFFSTLNFIVGVGDRRHLARIIRRLRGIKEVLRITRPRG
jgi:(p)ppGpp synthase/HD superfamily hydrolase